MTMREFRKLIGSAGASIDESSLLNRALVVDAPHGRIWTATGSHAMRADFHDSTQRAAIADLAARIQDGTGACTDDDCDTCHE